MLSIGLTIYVIGLVVGLIYLLPPEKDTDYTDNEVMSLIIIWPISLPIGIILNSVTAIGKMLRKDKVK